MVLSTWICVKQTSVSWKLLWYEGEQGSTMMIIIVEEVVLQSPQGPSHVRDGFLSLFSSLISVF